MIDFASSPLPSPNHNPSAASSLSIPIAPTALHRPAHPRRPPSPVHPRSPLPVRLHHPRRRPALQIGAARMFRLRDRPGEGRRRPFIPVLPLPSLPSPATPEIFVRARSLLRAGDGAPATRTGATDDHQTQAQLPSSTPATRPGDQQRLQRAHRWDLSSSLVGLHSVELQDDARPVCASKKKPQSFSCYYAVRSQGTLVLGSQAVIDNFIFLYVMVCFHVMLSL
jgi:hypothetical protein